MNIEIRPATPEDVREIQEVLYRTWLDTYPNQEAGITVDDIQQRFKYRFTLEFLSERSKQIANLPENETLLIAHHEDEVVGVCRAIRNPDHNQLPAIYVLPEYQGKGIGRLLWKAVQKSIDPTKDTIVEVATYNKKTIQFYENLGFKDTGKRWEDENFRMKSGAILPLLEMVMKARRE